MSRFTVQPAGTKDMFRILDDLSAQTAAEFHAVGMGAPEIAAAFADRVASGRAMVCLDNGEPLLICGFDEEAGERFMWTLAAKRYFDLGVAGVLATRRFFRQITILDKRPLKAVTSAPDREGVRRWMLKLGFAQIDADGLTQTFEYSRAKR